MLLPVNHFYRFGKFTVDTGQKVLWCADQPVRVTPKVFDTLLILLQTPRRIVEKEELMNRLWPDVFVEETNLTFNIQQLRKALGDSAQQPLYIETVPRRGYRFIAAVEEGLAETIWPNSQSSALAEPAPTSPPPPAAVLEPAVAPVSATPPRRSFTGPLARQGKLLASVGLGLVLGSLLYWRFSTSSGAVLKPSLNLESGGTLQFEKLTNGGESGQVALSPDGKYLAYTRDLQDKASIWLRQLSTNTNVELVPPNSQIYSLAFARNGESLYFVGGEPKTLARVSLLGGAPAKILENLEADFSVSADERQIAFVRLGTNSNGQQVYSLIIANSDGTNERALFTCALPEQLSTPIWKEDGSAILCAQGNPNVREQVRLIEIRIADGMKKELLGERFAYIAKLAWLPNQSGLLMTARKNPESSQNQLWRVSYPGLELRQLTADANQYYDLSVAVAADTAVFSQQSFNSNLWVGPSNEPHALKKITQAQGHFGWMPDSRLVFMSTVSGNSDIWSMQANGTEQRQLTTDPASDTSPVITPDHRFIVFLSSRSGTVQVMRMNLDGSNQVALAQGSIATVSPDGKWVVYSTSDLYQLWKVPIEGGEAVRLTDYFAIRPAVSPNGKLIACLGRNGAKREIWLVPFAGGPPQQKFSEAPAIGGRLRWTQNGQALLYLTKQNGTTTLVKQDLRGGSRQTLMSLGESDVADFDFSPDGKAFAVTRGNWQQDIVLIRSLKQ